MFGRWWLFPRAVCTGAGAVSTAWSSAVSALKLVRFSTDSTFCFYLVQKPEIDRYLCFFLVQNECFLPLVL